MSEFPIEQFGYIALIKHAGISDYVKYLAQGKFMATRCNKCGQVYFPPQKHCSKCISDQLEWVEYPYSNQAQLVSYSVLHFVPAGFDEKEAPFAVGIVEFPDGNRVYARIEGIPHELLRTGMRMKLVAKSLSEGRITHVIQPV